MQKGKVRLDQYLVDFGLAKDLRLASSLILSGSVLVNDRVVSKVGTIITSKDKVRLKEKIKTFVSRGAYKLLGAFEQFPKLTVQNKICVDLGASTGGFCQVLLDKNAKHVFAVDVGYGLLAQKIANHPKVTVLDRTHVKDLTWEKISYNTINKTIEGKESQDSQANPLIELPQDDTQYFFSMDLSFISLTSVFSQLGNLFQMASRIPIQGVSLLKPQFELPARYLEKGVVTDSKILGPCIRSVWRNIKNNNKHFFLKGLGESPIQGADGNREFLVFWEFRQ